MCLWISEDTRASVWAWGSFRPVPQSLPSFRRGETSKPSTPRRFLRKVGSRTPYWDCLGEGASASTHWTSPSSAGQRYEAVPSPQTAPRGHSWTRGQSLGTSEATCSVLRFTPFPSACEKTQEECQQTGLRDGRHRCGVRWGTDWTQNVEFGQTLAAEIMSSHCGFEQGQRRSSLCYKKQPQRYKLEENHFVCPETCS